MRAVTWLILVAFTGACAGAQVENVQRFNADRPLAKPSLMVLYDFAVSERDVMIDTFGPTEVTGPGEADERDARGRELAVAFGHLLVKKLDERGIVAARATDTPVPPEGALVVKGQFLTVDEGDAVKRVIIGFGAGTREVRVRVQTYQLMSDGLRRIAQGEGLSHGSKKPGMALPVIGGAIWGSVLISLAVSGSLAVISEGFGGMDAEMNRLAELLADRAHTFYDERGWL